MRAINACFPLIPAKVDFGSRNHVVAQNLLLNLNFHAKKILSNICELKKGIVGEGSD